MNKRSYQSIAVLSVVALAMIFLVAAGEEPAKAPAPGPNVFIGVTSMASVDINAPPEKVFNLLTDPNNLPKWMPECKSVSNIQGKGLGQTYQWVTESDGQKYEGQGMVVDIVSNQSITTMLSSGETWVGLFLPAGNGTKMMVSRQFHLAVPQNDPNAWPAAIKKAQDTLQGWTNNVKTELEKK